MRSKRQPDTPTHKVTGHTLREALQSVRRQYGEQARIVDTRTVSRRDTDGLGHAKLIEVSVAPPATAPASAGTPARPVANGRNDYARAISAEVERIEDLVAGLRRGLAADCDEGDRGVADYPLGNGLLTVGASRPAVRHLRRLFMAETGGVEDATVARDHLAGLIRTSGGGWRDLAGCHLFLGGPGAGKTDLVLGVAARLRRMKRRVLVLTYAPRHGGEVHRLQEEASSRGYDAAILRDAEQLSDGLERFGTYDAVLIDTPALGSATFTDDASQHTLAGLEEVHRHLLLPVDADLAERERTWQAARAWNCDWLALSRLDLTARVGKLIDILLAAPLPLSLVNAGAWPGPGTEIATSGRILERILSKVGEDVVAAKAG